MNANSGSAPESGSIAFIGAGNMGRAILGGLVAHGHPPGALCAADADSATCVRVAAEFGITASGSNREAAAAADVLVLAVKPQQLKAVVEELREALPAARPLILSIAAGITTGALAGWFGSHTPVVRCMPNTPALIGRGASALFGNAAASAEHRALAAHIMSAVGTVHWLADEAQMDAVTALSGSGPAYVFRLIEALEGAGQHLGLAPPLARQLALETVAGAAELALKSELDPARLRAQVTSKGGTTEAALKVLEDGGIDQLFLRALTSASERSRALAEEFGRT